MTLRTVRKAYRQSTFINRRDFYRSDVLSNVYLLLCCNAGSLYRSDPPWSLGCPVLWGGLLSLHFQLHSSQYYFPFFVLNGSLLFRKLIARTSLFQNWRFHSLRNDAKKKRQIFVNSRLASVWVDWNFLTRPKYLWLGWPVLVSARSVVRLNRCWLFIRCAEGLDSHSIQSFIIGWDCFTLLSRGMLSTNIIAKPKAKEVFI